VERPQSRSRRRPWLSLSQSCLTERRRNAIRPFPQFRVVPLGVVSVIPRIAAFSANMISVSLRGANRGVASPNGRLL
jgi:hypothetical protein